jgi:hypothetical protein
MIDTDKYEGRTPGHWSVTSIRDGSIPYNTADEELIADAPLLLEEVKRLREETKWFRERLCRHIGYDYCKSEYEKHFGREMIE